MTPLTLVMHLVLGADNTAHETGPMTFSDVVDAVRCGEYQDIRRVLSLTLEGGIGSAADVTLDVAKCIFSERGKHPIVHGSEAYIFVERTLSYRKAEMCAWEEAIERHRERNREMMRASA